MSTTYAPSSIFFATLISILPVNLLYPLGPVVSFIVYVSGVDISVICIVPKLTIPLEFVAVLFSLFTLNIAPDNGAFVSLSTFTISNSYSPSKSGISISNFPGTDISSFSGITTGCSSLFEL